jgi:hypothetical protein
MLEANIRRTYLEGHDSRKRSELGRINEVYFSFIDVVREPFANLGPGAKTKASPLIVFCP